jgi:hypothetical protein
MWREVGTVVWHDVLDVDGSVQMRCEDLVKGFGG